MRIWDVDPGLLCRRHLLGEHRELHGLWNIYVFDRSGYRQHPETRRWASKLAALFLRHELLVAEMQRRGYRHASPLDPAFAIGSDRQDVYIDPPEEQLRLLRGKSCECLLTAAAEPGAADPADMPLAP
ncbi:pyrimidine dimer DNA glycosylase/endonuclease V [soil metagenome]